MSCITKQHIGKYTYLYESTSFRNAEGKPRNKKVRIGKIDPYTGKTIYTEEYPNLPTNYTHDYADIW